MIVKKRTLGDPVMRFGALTETIVDEGALDLCAPAMSLAVLEPGAAGHPNRHLDAELLYIMQGQAEVIAAGRRERLAEGDAVYLPPLVEHRVDNGSADDPLRYLRIWWSGTAPTPARPEAAGKGPALLVTATPPTPNGNLHLGHMSGPYLAADVLARFARVTGAEVHYLTGIDDNQSYVALKALQSGTTAAACAASHGDQIVQAWSAFDIAPDFIGRPDRSPHHKPLVEDVFRTLHRAGKLDLRRAEGLHCRACDRTLFEAFVSGICPHCGQASCGNACEVCCRPNDCIDLLEPACSMCGAPPERVEYDRFFFPLSRYSTELETYLASVEMSPRLRALCQSMLRDGLPDIPVSHLSDYGLPVPVDGFEAQTIYVWFEMAAGYIAAARDHLRDADRWKVFWAQGEWTDAEPAPEIVQCFGMDNAYFHALLFPAIYLAYDPDLTPPRCFVSNEFLLLDGQKFSTSRGHMILATDFARAHDRDQIRFYLAMISPEADQTDFTVADFQRTVDRVLLGTWVPWLRDLESLLETGFDGRATAAGLWSCRHSALHSAIATRLGELRTAYSPRTFTLRGAAMTLCRLVEDAQLLRGAQAAPDPQDPYARTDIALQLAAARALSIGAGPLMPGFAQDLWHALGYRSEVAHAPWSDAPVFLPPAQRVRALGTAYFAATAAPG